jgi:hypothetical protein
MGRLATEAENINEEGPRQTVNLMRTFTEMTGVKLGGTACRKRCGAWRPVALRLTWQMSLNMKIHSHRTTVERNIDAQHPAAMKHCTNHNTAMAYRHGS